MACGCSGDGSYICSFCYSYLNKKTVDKNKCKYTCNGKTKKGFKCLKKVWHKHWFCWAHKNQNKYSISI